MLGDFRGKGRGANFRSPCTCGVNAPGRVSGNGRSTLSHHHCEGLIVTTGCMWADETLMCGQYTHWHQLFHHPTPPPPIFQFPSQHVSFCRHQCRPNHHHRGTWTARVINSSVLSLSLSLSTSRQDDPMPHAPSILKSLICPSCNHTPYMHASPFSLLVQIVWTTSLT